MGFKDLALFNDSLLAKHAWWLLQNSDSLFFKFFKARFFPNYSIMEAKYSSKGPMLGGVFYIDVMCYLEGVGGGWEMGGLCIFGGVHGCHGNTQPR